LLAAQFSLLVHETKVSVTEMVAAGDGNTICTQCSRRYPVPAGNRNLIVQSVYPPTNALNKIQFIIFIETPTSFDTGEPSARSYRNRGM
jgi:hypothetical protein